MMMQERRSLKEPKWDDQGFGDVVIFLSFQSLTLVENIVGMALSSHCIFREMQKSSKSQLPNFSFSSCFSAKFWSCCALEYSKFW